MSKGYVYLIRYDESGLHKIGLSADPEKRVKALAGKGFDLQIIHTISTDQMECLEKYLHQAFSHRRVKREWFRLSRSEVELVKSVPTTNETNELPRLVHRLWKYNLAKGFVWGENNPYAIVPGGSPYVDICPNLAEMVAVICTSRGICSEDYLGPILDAKIRGDYEAVVNEFRTLITQGPPEV